MIKIEREEPPKNTALDNKRKEELERIRKLAESGELKSKNFNRRLWSGKVKNFLYKSQHGKCCYCERNPPIEEAEVEHFRPKAEVKEAGENHPGYWWLAYNWENLLIACQLCNRTYKKTQFPLKDESKRAYEENCNLDEEDPLLINPLEEDPEQLICYEELEEPQFMVKAVGKCERAEKTVKELTGINDKYVMLRRADKLKYYRRWTKDDKLRSEAKKYLQEWVSPCSEFSGFSRFHFKKEGCL